MPQRQLDESIASERMELVRIAVKGKGAVNAFGEDPQQFIIFQQLVGAFLAGHHAAQLGHEIGEEGKFQEPRMGEKAGIPARFFHDGVHRHYAVKRRVQGRRCVKRRREGARLIRKRRVDPSVDGRRRDARGRRNLRHDLEVAHGSGTLSIINCPPVVQIRDRARRRAEGEIRAHR